jgi:Spy/CpxP family protein refolding chaperone
MFHRKNINSVLLLTLSIICLLCSAAYAMGGTAPSANKTPQTADQIVSNLTIYLSLTDIQAQQIKPIIEEDMAKRSAIRKADKGNRDAMMSALGDLRLQTNKKLAKFLNDDQIKKLIDMQKDQQENNMGGRTSAMGGRGGTGGMGGIGGTKAYNH